MRKHDKHKIWLFPGGHVELDEDPNQTAIREAKEEVGLDVILHKPRDLLDTTDLIAPTFVNRHKINETHEHVSFLYLATSKTDKLVPSTTEVSEECRWCSKEDLEEMDLMLIVKHYCMIALQIIGE